MSVMDTPHNLTKLAEADTVRKLVGVANTATDNTLTGMLLIGVFFIILMVLGKSGFDKAILVASYCCFILSLFLRYAGLINFIFVILFLALAAFTTLYMGLAARRGGQ